MSIVLEIGILCPEHMILGEVARENFRRESIVNYNYYRAENCDFVSGAHGSRAGVMISHCLAILLMQKFFCSHIGCNIWGISCCLLLKVNIFIMCTCASIKLHDIFLFDSEIFGYVLFSLMFEVFCFLCHLI